MQTRKFCSYSLSHQDIDLSWHTHQLKTKAYREETLAYLGRTPDHDDKVEEGALSAAYDVTARAWQSRFGVPYSVCGCGNSAGGVTDKISRLFISSSKSGEKSAKSGVSVDGSSSSAAMIAARKNPRPDLISVDDGDADATHPSEHNSVLVVRHPLSEYSRKLREKKLQKRKKEMLKIIEKGKYKDEWERLRFERALANERKQKRAGDRRGHDDAFMAVVPYWGM